MYTLLFLSPASVNADAFYERSANERIFDTAEKAIRVKESFDAIHKADEPYGGCVGIETYVATIEPETQEGVTV